MSTEATDPTGPIGPTPVRVDAHHHVWDLAVRDQPWTRSVPGLHRTFTLADLEPELEAHDVARTVLVQTVAVAEETPEMLALAAGSDRVAGVVGWVDLTAPDVADRLAALREGPHGHLLVGVRHLVQDEPASWFERPEVRAGLAAVGAAGLVYDLLVRADQLDSAHETVRATPGTSFVLDHAGKPVPGSAEDLLTWRDDLDRLAAPPHVTVKLSGLVTEAGPGWTPALLRPVGEAVLEAFGPERVMFGSDWPVLTAVATYADVLALAHDCTAGLDDTERDLVLGGAATATYGLCS